MTTHYYDDGRLVIRWINGRCIGFRVQHLEAICGRDNEQVLRRHEVLEAAERKKSAKIYGPPQNLRAARGKKLINLQELSRYWLTRKWG